MIENILSQAVMPIKLEESDSHHTYDESNPLDNETEGETVESLGHDIDTTSRLLNLIRTWEFADVKEETEEPMWYNFLTLMKNKVITKPEKIVHILNNWLHKNKRDRHDDDNINDFLLELYSSINKSYKKRKQLSSHSKMSRRRIIVSA